MDENDIIRSCNSHVVTALVLYYAIKDKALIYIDSNNYQFLIFVMLFLLDAENLHALMVESAVSSVHQQGPDMALPGLEGGVSSVHQQDLDMAPPRLLLCLRACDTVTLVSGS